jgi:hypothetical protein
MSVKPQQPGPPSVDPAASTIPMGLRILAIILRTLFFGALVVVTVHLSSPQSDTIWTAYETLGDLIRLALGFAVCLWIVDPSFHASQGRRGISDLGLPRPCGRPARIGGRHLPLVMCARNTLVLLWIDQASRATLITAVATAIRRSRKSFGGAPPARSW